MSREVTLVLADADGAPLGSLPPFTVDVPWWPEVADIVAEVRTRYGLQVAVLRVLGAADRPGPPGGRVTYAAEVARDDLVPPLDPLPADVYAWLAPHPRRLPWAEPGGPAATLAWARAALTAAGRVPTAETQQKSWNLSAIWRVDTAPGPTWLKQVPDFFAHEPAVVRWLETALPGLAPRLLAADGNRMLLDHAPGEDRFGAPPAEVALMLQDLHQVQTYATSRIDELLALGVPDRRFPVVLELIAAVAERYGAALGAELSSALDALVAGLPARFARVEECGVPDTLVHGDFHPGNVRSGPDGSTGKSTAIRTVIDWGDSTVGHPAMDIARATENLPPAGAVPLVGAWARRWREHTPGCEPDRALDLLRPVIALLYAVVYAGFLDRIEPSEWPYHSRDVPDYLRAAVSSSRR